jgi:transketolase
VPHEALREGFGRAIVAAAEQDERVVVLCADVTESARLDAFKAKFPTRYIELGVAEQNMAVVAAGLAEYGKIPYIATFAAFSPGRNWEQIRTTIALANLPVTIIGLHTGVSVGEDGATHQALEDITLMRVLPNMQIIVPVDAHEVEKAVHAARTTPRPTYIRLTRHKTPVFTSAETPFEIGRAEYLWRHHEPKVAIMGAGPILYDVLQAARILEQEGIPVSVLNLHSVKPMDIEKVKEAARDAGAVVSVEEHQILGGVGGTIAEILSQNTPTPLEMVAVHDRFGQSGSALELLREYRLDTGAIIDAARRAYGRAHHH